VEPGYVEIAADIKLMNRNGFQFFGGVAAGIQAPTMDPMEVPTMRPGLE
jgi:hypothetical protein